MNFNAPAEFSDSRSRELRSRRFTAEQIASELRSMGYDPKIQPDPCVREEYKIVFEYEADCGKYSGKKVLLGVSMRGNQSYPEYPPHWIHIHPPCRDRNEGGAHEYTDDGGHDWIAMSRPPKELWDDLPQKGMEPYMNLHIRKIFHNLQ